MTYRVTSTVLLAGISYVITGQWLESLAVTLSFALLATFLFYFNDRAWERTSWGKLPQGAVEAPSSGSLSHVGVSGSRFPSDVIPLRHEFLEEAS